MAPPLSRWGEEGFSSRSTCPRHRAVAITPPECPAASARCDGPCCLRLSTVRLGLRGSSISGPPVRSLPLRPGDSLTILSMAWSVGFRVSVSLHPATRVTGLWLLPRRDWLPLNTSAFPGRTVDHQLELRRLLDGKISGLGALENLVHVAGGASVHLEHAVTGTATRARIRSSVRATGSVVTARRGSAKASRRALTLRSGSLAAPPGRHQDHRRTRRCRRGAARVPGRCSAPACPRSAMRSSIESASMSTQKWCIPARSS